METKKFERDSLDLENPLFKQGMYWYKVDNSIEIILNLTAKYSKYGWSYEQSFNINYINLPRFDDATEEEAQQTSGLDELTFKYLIYAAQCDFKHAVIESTKLYDVYQRVVPYYDPDCNLEFDHYELYQTLPADGTLINMDDIDRLICGEDNCRINNNGSITITKTAAEWFNSHPECLRSFQPETAAILVKEQTIDNLYITVPLYR